MLLCLPPQGAIAGLALVQSSATHPASAARRVKYAAVPKWPELRTPIELTPYCLARSTPRVTACWVMTWPSPWPPSRTTSAPVSRTVRTWVTLRMAPLRRRATYQGSRSMPCEAWPQSSAVTRVSASSWESAAGTPSARSTASVNARRVLGSVRCAAAGGDAERWAMPAPIGCETEAREAYLYTSTQRESSYDGQSAARLRRSGRVRRAETAHPVARPAAGAEVVRAGTLDAVAGEPDAAAGGAPAAAGRGPAGAVADGRDGGSLPVGAGDRRVVHGAGVAGGVDGGGGGRADDG